MKKKYDHHIVDITLAPGEFFFGNGHTRIHTLLGSCIAITVWHPDKHIGGMCHYLLPSRGPNQHSAQGHYADEAVQLFINEIRKAQTAPAEYEVKLFGGSNMFSSLGHKNMTRPVSQHNIETGKRLLEQSGFSSLKAIDVGGTHHRKIYLELWNGDVWVRRGYPTNKGQH